MSSKRLLCAAVWSLCFAAVNAFAQSAPPIAQPALAPSAATAAVSKPAATLCTPVRNIVPVHGAFVDGSSWNGVVARLR